MTRRRLSARALTAVVAVVLLTGVVLTGLATTGLVTGLLRNGDGPPPTPGPGSTSAGPPVPMLGLLQPTLANAGSDRAAGVDAVVLSARWDRLEPRPGTLDPAALAAVREQAGGWTRAGLALVLSPGLQYPPAWVFALGGGTRFVDQHGTVFSGADGADVPDAVWNGAVRAAQAGYLSRLGAALAGTELAAVRAGGLLFGELRYPGQGRGTNSFWAFSASARASASRPGFVPGRDRDAARARQFVTWYLAALVDYERFVVGATRRAFPAAGVQVLLPGWGLRPGDVETATSSGLTGASPAEQDGRLNQGQAWAAQVRAIPAGSMAYLTNVTARSRGATVAGWAPVAYLAALADSAGVAVGGENAGDDSAQDLHWAVAAAVRHQLTALFWMNEAAFYGHGAGRPTLDDLAAAAGRLRAGSLAAGGRS